MRKTTFSEIIHGTHNISQSSVNMFLLYNTRYLKQYNNIYRQQQDTLQKSFKNEIKHDVQENGEIHQHNEIQHHDEIQHNDEVQQHIEVQHHDELQHHDDENDAGISFSIKY
jgi:hypothetical protein